MDSSQQDPLSFEPSSAASHGMAGAPSSQSAILNYFFPGFSMLSTAAKSYFGVDVSSFLPMFFAVLGIMAVWAHVRDSLWTLVDDYLMSSVRIRTDDEVYNMVMLWLSKQPFSRKSRHFLANTDLNSRHGFMYRYWESDDENERDDDDLDDSDGDAGPEGTRLANRKKPLHYTPAFGTHFFWYKGHPLLFERSTNREQVTFQTSSEREELTISCFGRNPRILKELLLEARQLHLKKDERKTLIYRGNLNETYWQRCMSRLNRPFSTVILSESVKRDLLEDATDYLDPATRRWYANRGIPYRRGYLLHGPPGTGKSSLSLALAGYFRMKIYIVSLSSTSATEENISSLFNELPTRCIVLLEDIDTAGLTHTREDTTNSESINSSPSPESSSSSRGRNSSSSNTSTSAAGRLSLSGLLNILDGVASQEGRILIMTTNHVDKLDKALIRPGRVDMIVPFGLADREMIGSIFRAIYAPPEDDTASASQTTGSKTNENTDRAEEKVVRKVPAIRERVDDLAQEFASKIPENEFSPAEVQGLLLRHKHDPEGVIAAAEDWVIRMRVDKKEQAEQEAERLRKAEQAKKDKTKKKKGKKDKKKEEEKKGRRQKRSKSTPDSNSDSGSQSGSESGSDSNSGSDTVDSGSDNSDSEREKKKQKQRGRDRKRGKRSEKNMMEDDVPKVQLGKVEENGDDHEVKALSPKALDPLKKSKPKTASDSGYETP
ncbi:hypothetical protein HIM_05949 [Hirsutella minnesotensis 3608]|uniref:Mitochondrial chaperone BCS1-B n=1 Tax=Hirsutella minnesotensis 3608 TaxID=1043627 RepID=A0A0F8A527_9HYPO|nr:hypothetical protein HIM_05949 [Hirsutella minnesotensis 3608]